MVTSNLELLPNKYILHPGCKDVDLQIASLPYTILLDPCASLAIYLEVDSSGNFFQFKCSLKKKISFSFQFLHGCILKQANTKVLADSTCGMNKLAGNRH